VPVDVKDVAKANDEDADADSSPSQIVRLARVAVGHEQFFRKVLKLKYFFHKILEGGVFLV